MNITLAVDDEVLKKAREAAQAQGKSVNQLVREYLEQFSAQSDLEQAIATFRATARTGHGSGQRFNRDELHERT